MFLVLVFGLAGIFADVLAPYNPTANDFAAMTEPPSWAHLLGTDQLGRDLLSRILYGARTAFLVGLTSALVGGFGGLMLGVGSAYFGGQIDLWLQRIIDIFMSFPLIIMALAVVSIFGTGVENVIAAITIPLIPRCARVVRSSALAIREIPYVDAARALGFGHIRIILRHMVPNVMGPFLVIVTAFVGQAILAEASLSYLGSGRAGAGAGLGADAARRRRGIRDDGAVDRRVPRSRDHADRVRHQSVRRLAARRARSEAARPLSAPVFRPAERSLAATASTH